MKTAEMFLSELTIVDHAYIDNNGMIVGGSFNPTFYISGNVDETEHVVVDFSTIKKDIKSIIDDKKIGFDHKLWVIDGYSHYFSKEVSADNVIIETPTTLINMPITAIKEFECPHYGTNAIGDEFAKLIESELRKKYGESIKVTCVNTVTPHIPIRAGTNVSYFSYVHGLKDSTSWGCQNISHGHLSFIQFDTKDTDAFALQEQIAFELDNTIFINEKNIITDTYDILTIGYTTERGYFNVTYDKTEYKLTVLPTETTIEHLVDYVYNKYNSELAKYNIKTIFVSEGLSKGAMLRL